MRPVYSLVDYWLAQTLQLREAHSGPLEDASEVRRARQQGHTFTDQILLRARYLGSREKLGPIIRKWTQGAKLALAIMMIVALLTGIGAALGALGDGSRPVNVLLALVALLGLHSLTFALWLLSFAVGGGDTGAWLGRLWLWLTRKLARGPDAALIPRALVDVLGQNAALRWSLSGISHALWAMALLAVLVTLLALLSARRYSFNWETTILATDTLVYLTGLIGWLPAQLGFAMPSEAVVRASDGLQTLPGAAQALWSSWLIGCIVVYGLAPRLISLIVSLLLANRNIAAIGLDESLPAYANLRKRLQPTHEKMGIDAPDSAQFQAGTTSTAIAQDGITRPLLAGIELAPETPWPPQPLAADVGDMGMIDTRAQRHALLDRLQQCPPHKLLLVCDGRQTPDRGVIALMADLASVARHTHIALSPDFSRADQMDDRSRAWHARLMAAGFDPQHIHVHLSTALDWLSHNRGPHEQG